MTEDLTQGKSQSDGSTLTPYQQAQRYGSSLPYSMRPRWVIVCNFAEFLIYDMETLAKPTRILLEELPDKLHAFDFLVDHTKTKLRVELELSLKAGEIVGKLYDSLRGQYINPDSEDSLVSLNKLCVRLVFCLFAESSGIFGKHKIFRDYLSREHNIRRVLLDLFDVLNTPTELRDPYLDDTLKKFPYDFTNEIKALLLEEASSVFNWSGISPTIFGAVFEATLNPITRRAAGMHYTSPENIHVYNNFPWCEPSKSARRSVELYAQAVLDVRAKYPDATLADLYDPLSMPVDLRKAHRVNDKAVALAFGFGNFFDAAPPLTPDAARTRSRSDVVFMLGCVGKIEQTKNISKTLIK